MSTRACSTEMGMLTALGTLLALGILLRLAALIVAFDRDQDWGAWVGSLARSIRQP